MIECTRSLEVGISIDLYRMRMRSRRGEKKKKEKSRTKECCFGVRKCIKLAHKLVVYIYVYISVLLGN